MLASEDIQDKLKDTYIETSSGIFVSPLDENFQFEIEDIAHALSHISRWNGHCRHFYSVAQHSMLVADIMTFRGFDGYEGLLHDGTEAYLCDIPSPLKQLFPDWRKVDKTLESRLRTYYGLSDHKTPECAFADWVALYLEADRLLPSRGKKSEHWTHPDPKVYEWAMDHRPYFRITKEDPQDVKWGFLDDYDRYVNQGRTLEYNVSI